MDSFMSSFSAQQALEWEMYAKDHPSFEDVILLQIANIAQLFASALFKKKDGTFFTVEDFMPWRKGLKKYGAEEKEKEVNPLLSSFKKILLTVGGDKAKAWAAGPENERPKVRGTDGKMYTYALEEFATRTKPPKRMNRATSKGQQ